MASRKFTLIFSILTLAALLLSACQGMQASTAGQNEPTALPPVIADTGVIAEGRIVPSEFVELSFNTSGRVAEVLVAEGDIVTAGDVIARLGDREELESRMAGAELDLLSARQELLNAEEARQALFDDLPDAQTRALQAVTDAKKEVRDSDRQVTFLNTPAEKLDIDAAHAQMILARKVLEDAQEAYDPYADRSEESPVRAMFLNRLVEAQKAYEAAERRYNNMIAESATEFDESQAQAKLEIAQSRLAIAEKEYDTLTNGPDPSDMKMADIRIETAKGRISAAEAALAAAKAAVIDLDLVATISGTVVDLNLIAGQTISPGTTVIELADFSQVYVETDNLTEIEVVNISVGQQASITPDAIPDLTLSGSVEKIALRFEEKRGDVTYTVRLRLENPDPRLRWGMTVSVVFSE